MKKFLNEPKRFVDEVVDGILKAHPNDLKCVDGNSRVLVRCNKKAGKVAIVTGGGSGHLPLFLGYVGEGLLDGCAVGNVFASPSAHVIYEVTKAVDSGAGVFYLFGNYSGDRMNFEMAAEMAEIEGIRVEQLKVADDIASAPKGYENKRRGIAGIFFTYKIAGAAAEKMFSIDEVVRLTRKAHDNIRSIGVATSSCILPEVGKPNFVLNDNEMEIGMGIHGEPGIIKMDMKTADEVTTIMLDRIFEDMQFVSGDKVAVLINGLGGTPKEEMYIVYRKIHSLLQNKCLKIHRSYIGEFATSMEMAGFSITLFKLDHELEVLLDMSAYSPFFEQQR